MTHSFIRRGFLSLTAIVLLTTSVPVRAATPPLTNIVPQQQVSPAAWRDLISFRPALPVQQAFNARSQPVWLQHIEDGQGDANLDLYEVSISTFPINPATGIRFAPAAFFDYIRTNLNQFVDNENYTFITNFRPYSDSPNDRKWNDPAQDPTGSLISIGYALNDPTMKPLGSDSVLTAKYIRTASEYSWIFTTAYTAADMGNSFAGNREFKLKYNGSQWIFSIRGAHRNSDVLFNGNEKFEGDEIVYGGIQNKVAHYVNLNGGSASTPAPTSYPYHWATVCVTDWQPSIAWDGQNVVRDASKCNGDTEIWVPLARRSGYIIGMQIQNLSAASANVTIEYINPDGYAVFVAHKTIPGNSSITSLEEGPSFGGCNCTSMSAKIRSDQPITVATNFITPARTSSSANAVYGGSAYVNLPVMMRNNNGYSTWFAVQNTHWKPVDIVITYYYPAGGIVVKRYATIPAGASQIFDQNSDPLIANGFRGSAQIVANGAVAAVVHEESSTGLMSYAGLTTDRAGVSLNAPLIMSHNNGWSTDLNVQNVGAYNTTVRVKFSSNTASSNPSLLPPCAGTPQDAVLSVARGSAVTFNQEVSPAFVGCRYVGSATITADQPLQAVINELSASGASAYEALNSSFTTGTVQLPIIQVNNAVSRIWTGVQVQNAGQSLARYQVIYSPNSATASPNPAQLPPCATTPANDDFWLLAGASRTLLLSNNDPRFANCRYVGSAKVVGIEGWDAKAAVIVNQMIPNYIDQLLTYVGW